METGLDRAAAPSPTKAKQMLEEVGGSFWCVYIGGPTSAASGWTPELVGGYVNEGIQRFLPIYAGRQSGGPLTEAQGLLDAQEAVTLMRRFGWGQGAPCVLDVEEPTSTGNPAGAAAYTGAFCHAMRQAGYVAGVYGAPSFIARLRTAPNRPDLIFVADWIRTAVDHSLDPAQFPPQLMIPDDVWAGARAWQYAGGDGVAAGGLSVDIDVANCVMAPPPDAAVIGPPPPEPVSDADFPRNPATGWLLPAAGSVTAGFGATEEVLDSGATYLGRQFAHFNKGIDVGSSEGTPVRSTTDGVVTIAADIGDGWNTAIKIVDPDGITHNYGHLLSMAVGVGDRVTRGQTIAATGTGDPSHSTGAHLSYDVFRQSAGGKEWVDATLFLQPADANLPGIEARVLNAGGANLRTAPDISAHVRVTLPDGARLRLRGRAMYPMFWSAAVAPIWSGRYSIDAGARPADAAIGAVLPKPSAMISVIDDPFWGSRALVNQGGVWAVAGPAPAGATQPLPFPEWYPVRAGARCGWVHSSLLEFVAVEITPEEAAQGAVPGIVLTVNDDSVRFRSAPEFGENVIDIAMSGTKLALRAAAYVPVDFHGNEGWVWASLLGFSAVAGALPPTLDAVVLDGRTPNVRAAPDERATLLGQVSAGTRLTLRPKAFYPVRWKGRDGWTWGEFLTAGAGQPPL